MLEARVSRTRYTPKEETEAETKEEIAYTPIGIPLIADPGAISSVMIFSSEAENCTKGCINSLGCTNNIYISRKTGFSLLWYNRFRI